MKINVATKQLDLTHRAAVMTIINITPDSFYQGSRSFDTPAIEARVKQAIEQGSDILDLGGYSSRPGAEDVSAEEELNRLTRGFEIVRSQSDIIVSIDTFRAEIVEALYSRFGAFIVNDITGGDDPQMYETVAKYSLPYICMHCKGTPQTMQSLTQYDNLVEDIEAYFTERIAALKEAGVEQIILDLGFGFAKTLEQNYELFAQMERFNSFGLANLVGISRKSMIYKPLNSEPADSLAGTTILNWEALKRGAKILRVHDTLEAAQTISMFTQFKHYFL